MSRTLPLLLFIFFIAIPCYLFSQQSTVVHYIEKPDEHTLIKIKDNTALLQVFVEEKTFNVDGMTLRQKGAHYGVFYDVANQQTIKQEILLKGDVTLLAIDETPPWSWEFVEGQKEILGYPCQRAILKKDALSNKAFISNIKQVEVWFTPDIPIALGPDRRFYQGLPGLVLGLTIHYDRTDELSVYNIQAISIENQDLPDLRPTEGVWVSAAEMENIKGYTNKQLKAWVKEQQK
jgi:GLPGLI family protein